ncbi:hypothetical protein CEXT_163601 [Caerostris extrusa]|uniref:Uncharacterized protein n=1 Tax=Caerostris extrusa TaxID=172846 RepID=A0AAV4PWK1_CAEEX|nr:hypothetical protein CEXT_163601 [Caerostris extrusa]
MSLMEILWTSIHEPPYLCIGYPVAASFPHLESLLTASGDWKHGKHNPPLFRSFFRSAYLLGSTTYCERDGDRSARVRLPHPTGGSFYEEQITVPPTTHLSSHVPNGDALDFTVISKPPSTHFQRLEISPPVLSVSVKNVGDSKRIEKHGDRSARVRPPHPTGESFYEQQIAAPPITHPSSHVLMEMSIHEAPLSLHRIPLRGGFSALTEFLLTASGDWKHGKYTPLFRFLFRVLIFWDPRLIGDVHGLV